RFTPREGLSTVGSGDSFLAGFLAGWYAKEPPQAALRLGVACGAANTQTLGAGVFDPADLEALARPVEVTAPEGRGGLAPRPWRPPSPWPRPSPGAAAEAARRRPRRRRRPPGTRCGCRRPRGSRPRLPWPPSAAPGSAPPPAAR